MDTEEEFVYTAGELKARVPLIIAAIIRYGVNHAVKKRKYLIIKESL